MDNKVVIKKLISIIDNYDDNDVSKDIILNTSIKNDNIVITRLVTKGEANKNTPFYSCSMYTMIIEEFYYDGVCEYAEIIIDTSK